MGKPRYCGARKKQGKGTCKRPAGWGTKHPGHGNCKLHGGSTRTHVVAAAKLVAHEEAARMVARAGVDVDPIEHLLESLHRAAALVEVWGLMVAKLDEHAAAEAEANNRIRGQLSYYEADAESHDELVVMSGDRLLALDRHGMAQLHPFYREYRGALELRARLAKLCLDAGVAERQVRIAEEQGQLIAKAIKGILDELGVGDRKEVPGVVRKHLTLVRSA